MEGGEQIRIASSICSSRFSAASVSVRAEIGLEGFQSRDRRLLFTGGKFFADAPESLFGMRAAAYFSTRLTASFSTARLSKDSLPAMKIPVVMYTVYSYQSFLAIAVFKIVTFSVNSIEP
jgi:hypothetical protein